MIEFKEGSYFIGFWFVGGADTDWFAGAWREQSSSTWIFRARFRYHSPTSRTAFDNEDRKSPMEFEVDGTKKTEDDIIRDVALIAGLIGQRFGVEPEFVEVRGDRDKALFCLAMKPWAHIERQAIK
ncbi:MAG: hypothetical protein PCFJNLEI_01378 [Verrucomicrobiae bacterium]|nr:hypothetical protein [Verrucomicrobiae bacterium]